MTQKQIVVVADDITGAAELAGIAHSHALRTELRLSLPDGDVGGSSEADVIVVATDTRSMTQSEAVLEVRRVVAALMPLPGLLFKKTDSALRGHVVPELQAMMQASGRRRAIFMPANPSKGRVISGGVYYIGGKPIAETDFSFDPEFPAFSSALAERFPDAATHHIVMPDAATASDVEAIAMQAGPDVVMAGAADLFEKMLPQISPQREESGVDLFPPLLILCGSTQSRPLPLDIPLSPMPLSVYDGDADLSAWLADAGAKYAAAGSLQLTIPHRHRTGRAVAVHLRQSMAAMTVQLADMKKPRQLVVEGGATAFAVLQRLGWSQFRVESQLAPGVVSLVAADGTRVVLKPGSYPWGEGAWAGCQRAMA